jgi:phosphohistidine phosphatase
MVWHAEPMASNPTRQLILLRHAKSAWPDGIPDHERPLAPRGRRDAPAAGRWLRKTDHVPDLVRCSTARRTRETWQLAEEMLGALPRTVFDDQVYEASIVDLLDLVRQTSAGIHTLLVVGHDPAMRGLTLELAGAPLDDAEAQALARVRVKYPTAAIAVLRFSCGWAELGPGLAQLADFVVPGDFHAEHGKR